MTGENKINKDVLCILIQNKESKQIEIRFMEIEKDLEVEFTNLEKIFEVKHYNANTIATYIMNHKTLSKLFNYYDYCKDLSKPWQGITSILEIALSSYSSNFDSVKDPEKRKELVDKQKRELLLDCKERLIAMRLEKSYKKCQKEETIIAFSHRKVGWSTPKYALDDNFSVEIKTNFGYGNSSYFYSKLRYKELDIIPFTDWVSYRFANIFEIIQYSKKHYLMNESWLESMQFIRSYLKTFT